MLTIDSPFQEFVDLCERAGGCEAGIEWGRMRGSITLGQGLRLMLSDDRFLPRWGAWCIWKTRSQLPDDLVLKLIDVFSEDINQIEQVDSVLRDAGEDNTLVRQRLVEEKVRVRTR